MSKLVMTFLDYHISVVSSFFIITFLCRHALPTSSSLPKPESSMLTTSSPRSMRRKVHLTSYLGLGKYVGYFLLISYFTLLPKLFQAILPFLIQHLPRKIIFYQDKLIMGFGVVFINVFILVSYNITMIFIYRAKHPFFQKYRVSQVFLG